MRFQPTKPEADGTFVWRATTLIVVAAEGGGRSGMGYTYADRCAATLVAQALAAVVCGLDAMDRPMANLAMRRAVRNLGREGVAATAISAVDAALWDLKAILLELPLALLLGRVRDAVPIYGSGGFTTYSEDDLRAQLSQWVESDGCRWVKMKIGSEPERDPARVAVARKAVGEADFSLTPMAPFRSSRQPPWRASWRKKKSAGSKSLSRRTISKGWRCCAGAGPDFACSSGLRDGDSNGFLVDIEPDIGVKLHDGPSPCA